MEIVFTIVALVAGFFIINGIGKFALHLYTHERISPSLTYRLTWISTVVWYLFAAACLTSIAWRINLWFGVVAGVVILIVTFMVGLRSVGRDTRNSLDLARERRHKE